MEVVAEVSHERGRPRHPVLLPGGTAICTGRGRMSCATPPPGEPTLAAPVAGMRPWARARSVPVVSRKQRAARNVRGEPVGHDGEGDFIGEDVHALAGNRPPRGGDDGSRPSSGWAFSQRVLDAGHGDDLQARTGPPRTRSGTAGGSPGIRSSDRYRPWSARYRPPLLLGTAVRCRIGLASAAARHQAGGWIRAGPAPWPGTGPGTRRSDNETGEAHDERDHHQAGGDHGEPRCPGRAEAGSARPGPRGPGRRARRRR